MMIHVIITHCSPLHNPYMSLSNTIDIGNTGLVFTWYYQSMDTKICSIIHLALTDRPQFHHMSSTF